MNYSFLLYTLSTNYTSLKFNSMIKSLIKIGFLGVLQCNTNASLKLFNCLILLLISRFSV